MANETHNEDRSRLTDPADPPASLLRPEARRAALLSYLGPVIILFAVVGVALLYWINRGPVRTPAAPVDRSAIGTAGSVTPGGGDPRPRYDSTSGEIRDRGGDAATGSVSNGQALTSVDAVRASGSTARRVSLSAVEVDSVDGSTMWVRDGDARLAVALPKGAAPPGRGGRVDVSGMTETRDGTIRVVADAVHAR